MSKNQEQRKKRVPLGVPRLKLSVTERKGYQRRWVNDVGDRLLQAQEGGYEFVTKNDAEFTEPDAGNQNVSVNDKISKVVGTDGTKAYLMEIPLAMYNSDQIAKAKRIDEVENGLKHGDDAHGRTGSDGRYVPREGIKIE